ncbi:hypothetical protein HDU98_005968 [Podochytrium sp. JEL0797]|nr:hypothetical protein HDU98_005968 [Podochytrium sp. JEL0797]
MLVSSSAPQPSTRHALEENIRALQLSRLQLDEEIALLPIDIATAESMLKAHLQLIHDYNKARDDGQKLFGLIAERTGETVASVYERFGMSSPISISKKFLVLEADSMRTSLLLLSLCTALTSASRGASGYRGPYGDVHASSEQFRKAHPNTAAKADDIFLFFSLHDYDHNSHLDGHELRVAFAEFETKEKGVSTLAEVEKLVDAALEKDDHNGDGLISWTEYLQSQQNAESK